MRIQNARQEIRNILSFFSGSFSRPSFKIFSSFIISFIQLGKEVHTSSMVQSVAHSFLRRSLCSFTRFLGKSVWTVEEVTEIVLHQFFQTLRITARDVLFLIVDDSLVKKTGKKIPGCGWHAYSDAIRPPIPIHSGRPFRSIPATPEGVLRRRWIIDLKAFTLLRNLSVGSYGGKETICAQDQRSITFASRKGFLDPTDCQEP